MSSRAFPAAILITLFVAGCAESAPSPSLTPSRPPATASPSASVVPASEFVPPTLATFEPSTGTSSAEWNLVALGDSNVAGWGIRDDEPHSPAEAFPGVYAASLANELGVTVTLHSYYPDQLGNEVREIAEWTDVIARDPTMRADLTEARVVVVLIGFHDLIPVFLHGACPSSWPDPLRECLNGYTQSMPDDFAELYAAIAGLVPSAATVLVLDYGSSPQAFATWGDDLAWPEMRQAMFGDWQDALRAAAATAGFTVVHMSTALIEDDGAPKYDRNEVTSDGLHFNSRGHRILADQILAEDGL